MKKIILLLLPILIFIIYPNSTRAQSQVSAGIGTGTIPEAIKSFSDLAGNIVSFGTLTQRNETRTNALFFSYRYYLQDRLSLEGSFVYEGFTDDLYFNDNNSGNESYTYYAVIAGACYKYLSTGWFGMSAELEAGISDANEDQTINNQSASQSAVHLGLQITPLLFSFGNSFGINVGLGFGYKGILRGSVYYLF